MQRPRRRKRERVIPATELAWVREETNDFWHEPASLTKEQVARAHFENRQRDGVVVDVSSELRKVEEYVPMLRSKFETEKPERGDTDIAKLLAADPDFPYRNRILPFGAAVREHPYKPHRPGLINPKNAEECITHFKEFIQQQFVRYDWMKESILYPLGPEQIRKIRDCVEGPRKRRNMHLPMDVMNQLLIYNNQSSAFIAAHVKYSREHTIKEIEQLLGPSSAEHDEVTISEPNSGYGVQLSYGKEPEFVLDAKSSKFAVIFDYKYLDHLNKKGKDSMKCKRFYEDLLNCSVVSTRTVNDPEKRWMEQRLQRNDLRPRPLRVLEFKTLEERNKAMEKKSVEHLDLFFCDTQFGYRSFHETLHMYIKYEMTVKSIECISITLMDETDKKFAESVFRAHGLYILYFARGYKVDMELRYSVDCRTMVLQDFPRHMFRHEVREWFVRRICEKNHIQYERIHPFTQRVTGAMGSANKAKKRDIAALIEFEFYRIGQIHGFYRPIDSPWVEEMQGGAGARCFFDLVRSERPDRPWKVNRKNEGEYQETENFTVHFKSIDSGRSFIRQVLQDSYMRPIFQVDRVDCQGPEIRPCYRKTFACTRSIRVVLHNGIKELDLEMRTVWTHLTRNEDPLMARDESIYYRLRVHEEWKSGSEAGIIGVMGWTPDTVTYYAQKLELLLQPKTFGNCPNLLYGVGETYAKSLTEKYHDSLLIEVDKFNEEIKLLGDAANDAIKDLENYSENRAKIGINCEIPMYFPFMNERTVNAFTPEQTEHLRIAMGINFLFLNYKEKMLQFEGSIEQYEQLMKYLEELSLEVYKNETLMRVEDESAPKLQCPICWTEIGLCADFYRFQCGHVMCRQCTNSKIRNISTTDMVTKCDFEGCDKFVSPSEIMNIILGGPLRLRDFDSIKLHQLVTQSKAYILNSTRDMIGCISANCTGLLTKSDGDPLEYKTCVCCSRKYCRLCLLEPHAGNTCEEYSKLRKPDMSMKAYMDKAGNVKACPKCGSFIEKKEGCNHMECKCGEHWCWLCQFHASSSGPIYGHMTEVHGGHGGVEIDVNALEDGDPDMQRFLMGDARVLPPFPFSDSEDDDESDEEDTSSEDEDRARWRRVPHWMDPNFIRQQQEFGNIAWGPPPPPPPGIIPPGIPAPVAVSQPRRLEPVYELPTSLMEIYPMTEEDVDVYLKFINTVSTEDERTEKVNHLEDILIRRRNGEEAEELRQMMVEAVEEHERKKEEEAKEQEEEQQEQP